MGIRDLDISLTKHDGGRESVGLKPRAGEEINDCLTRAIAIVTGWPYVHVSGRLLRRIPRPRRVSLSPKQMRAYAHIRGPHHSSKLFDTQEARADILRRTYPLLQLAADGLLHPIRKRTPTIIFKIVTKGMQ